MIASTCVQTVETKPGAFELRVNRLEHVQPHLVNHGHGAVVHGVELVQPTRLEPARHEEHVGGGGEAVRRLVAEPDPRADLVVGAQVGPFEKAKD
jgi:hypothetical protein